MDNRDLPKIMSNNSKIIADFKDRLLMTLSKIMVELFKDTKQTIMMVSKTMEDFRDRVQTISIQTIKIVFKGHKKDTKMTIKDHPLLKPIKDSKSLVPNRTNIHVTTFNKELNGTQIGPKTTGKGLQETSIDLDRVVSTGNIGGRNNGTKNEYRTKTHQARPRALLQSTANQTLKNLRHNQ